MVSREIGADGWDLPDTVEVDGVEVAADLVYDIRSRALTWRGREMFQPGYGISVLAQTPNLDRRIRTSLGQITYERFSVAREGRVLLDRLAR